MEIVYRLTILKKYRNILELRMMNTMTKCVCGSQRFIANQICRHEVLVDQKGNWMKDLPAGIYDAENPYGPFICRSCGRSYDGLHQLVNNEDK